MNEEIKKALEKALPDIARRIQNELIIAAPVDTGRLRNSIRVMAVEGGLIIGMVEYGKFVEFGTPPHIIRPKSKKALSFEWTEVGGQMVGEKGRKESRIPKSGATKAVFKEVHHPGTRPNPFIRNTIQNKIKKIIVEEINNNI